MLTVMQVSWVVSRWWCQAVHKVERPEVLRARFVRCERGSGVVMETNKPCLGAVLNYFMAELAVQLGDLCDERCGHVRCLEEERAADGGSSEGPEDSGVAERMGDDGGVKNFLSQQVRVIAGAVCHEMFLILGDGTSVGWF